MCTDREITTYKEWLGLDKGLFGLLILIALNGNTYKGNLSDLCRSLNLSSNDNNRSSIRERIEKLDELGYIDFTKSGYTYTLTIIPKVQEIRIKKYIIEYLFSICGVGVSREMIIKTYLWYVSYGDDLCTNEQIANELKCSTDTVSNANKYLTRINAILKANNTVCENGKFATTGHHVTVNAWLDTKM